MDQWKYFDITHREHVLCNPLSMEKLEQLVALLRLRPRDRIVEIASGKGEFIIRLAEEYGIEGVGVDLSPYFVSDAQEKRAKRIPDSLLQFFEMDGADYKPDEPESLDLAACIGASWIYGGHRGTLEALSQMVVPGGWVVVGEPYWRREPTQEYMDALGAERNTYGAHYENVDVGQRSGMELVYTLVSSLDDWDKYEGLQWYAAAQWASEHPEDPDVVEVLRQVHENRRTYLRWGRQMMGWAIYAFRKNGVSE